jgi:hypothetical protein
MPCQIVQYTEASEGLKRYGKIKQCDGQTDNIQMNG